MLLRITTFLMSGLVSNDITGRTNIPHTLGTLHHCLCSIPWETLLTKHNQMRRGVTDTARQTRFDFVLICGFFLTLQFLFPTSWYIPFVNVRLFPIVFVCVCPVCPSVRPLDIVSSINTRTMQHQKHNQCTSR